MSPPPCRSHGASRGSSPSGPTSSRASFRAGEMRSALSSPLSLTQSSERDTAMTHFRPPPEPPPGVSCPEFPLSPSRVPLNILSPWTWQGDVPSSKQKRGGGPGRKHPGTSSQGRPAVWEPPAPASFRVRAVAATAPGRGPGSCWNSPEPQRLPRHIEAPVTDLAKWDEPRRGVKRT